MKKIIFIASIFVLCICGIIIIKNIKNRKFNEIASEIENTDEEESEWWIEESKRREVVIKQEYISEEEIYEMTKSNPNWDVIDIAKDKKEILKKNYPNGILLGNEYDDIRLEENYKSLIDPMGGPLEFNIIAKKGLKKDKYKIVGTGYGNLFLRTDFEVYEIQKFELIDENGIEVNSGIPMDEEHWLENVYKISKTDNKEVAKSKNFYEKYPSFTGILNPYHYEDINAIEIKWDSSKVNYNNKELYCNVYYPYRYIYIDYMIKLSLDNNKYLDGFELIEINKREFSYEINKYKNVYFGGIIQKLVYDNRDWNILPLTENFKEKFSPEKGIFNRNDIIKYEWIYFNKNEPDKIVLKVNGINNDFTYYGLVYELDSNKTKIDNIVIKVLDINDHKNYTSEEIYKMF